VVVNAANDGDLETTVHWHGLRLDNRFDGTHHTQDPIEVGGTFGYRISFPDPGVYWYHPHIRQDYGQEMGLYGTIVVEPADPDYWPPVHREIVLTLDDVLLTDGAVAPFSRTLTTHTAMGRFGDVLLVNGDSDLKLTARAGEVVRLYLVNTANTRVFNVAIPDARIKLVGGDSGRFEHEQFVQSVILAPSERGRRRRAVHWGRCADDGAPHPRPGLPTGRDHRHRGTRHPRPGRGIRHLAHQRGHGRRTRPDRPDARSRPE
jgi:FtsP/CotA-like multicopper oxidase with cupredoxin domain